MRKPTGETTRLTSAPARGSPRARLRCACRAFRCGGAAVALAAVPRDAAGLSAAALPLPPGSGPVVGGGDFLADVPDRRNVRAGDDGGSGVSHANAAVETDGRSACAGRSPARAAETVRAAEPGDARGP